MKMLKLFFSLWFLIPTNLLIGQDWKSPWTIGPNWVLPSPNIGTGNSQPAIDQATPWSLGGNSILGIGQYNGQILNNLDPLYKYYSIGTVDDAPFILKANNNESILLLQNGYVGIGLDNTVPNAPLSIWSSSYSPGNRSRINIFPDINGVIESDQNLSLMFNTGKTFNISEGQNSNSLVRMTVKGPNVGINTTVPQSALDITSINSGAYFRIYGDNNGSVYSTTHMRLHFGLAPGQGNQEFHIIQGAPSDPNALTRMAFNLWGAKIHTNGLFAGLFIGPDNSTWYNQANRLFIDATNSDGLMIAGGNNNNPFDIINASGATRFKVNISNNNGDDTQIDMRGSVQIGYYQSTNTWEDANTRLNVSALSNGIKVTTSAGGAKAFFVENPNNFAKSFIVFGDGKTRIGAGAPDPNGVAANALLTVDGMILAKDIRVSIAQSTHWADYVFEKNYRLMSLKELEEYVNKNKHLPEMPSEAEVKKEGVDITQMNIILLKKVEELTLYNIQLFKLIEKQNERIKALENGQH